ncbi:PREDICTED: mas-related G-protein coupled receptor member D-like [Nanorana parkeri]|uniref:mas-related G-protein coupled receptor member D-like n=1 Tax=Nanorana parkeri TaxID=125878 RepID=UPI000854BF11|nr:PREDICTED: mas-related G-protein coupled receptor member D-like [Nanorana parkeri]
MNDTLKKNPSGYNEYSYIHFTIAAAVALCLCVVGLVGNVIVFWYLRFKIQRNKYTVYIMNLSAADALFLIFTMLLLMVQINRLIGTNPNFIGKENLYLSIEIFFDAMQYSGMFILTAVSMERCSAVLFPFWYQSHRPRNLSTIMCTALWILGCLESLLENLVCTTKAFKDQTVQCSAVQIVVFVLAIGICLPIMVISSFTLLAKVKRTFKQRYTPKLYIIIIIAVFVFILSVLPFNFLWFLMFFRLLPTDLTTASLFLAAVFSTVLNCTANPYIYFIVGKKWKQKSHYSIQEALQRAFREEDFEHNDLQSNKTTNTSSQTNLTAAF